MRTWPRLGLDMPQRPETAEHLRRLASELRYFHRTDPAALEAADWLEQLSRRPKALQLLTSKGRGRRREPRNLWIALDYLASRELAGSRRYKQAQLDVAAAWRMSPKRVSGAWTDHRRAAALTLSELLRWSTARGLSRAAALEAVSADIREANIRPRRNSR